MREEEGGRKAVRDTHTHAHHTHRVRKDGAKKERNEGEERTHLHTHLHTHTKIISRQAWSSHNARKRRALQKDIL